MKNEYRVFQFIGLKKVVQDMIDASAPTGTGDSDDITQEELMTESIVSVDKTLADTLSTAPKDADGVTVYLNGVIQDQGAGLDYQLVGATLQQVRWLAGSGTAVYMETSDTLLVVYEIIV